MQEKLNKCEADNLQYLSLPTQNRCKKCGQFWFSGKEIPDCKLVEMNSINLLSDNNK